MNSRLYAKRPGASRQSGFTLVEIMVVLALIAAITYIGGLALSGNREAGFARLADSAAKSLHNQTRNIFNNDLDTSNCVGTQARFFTAGNDIFDLLVSGPNVAGLYTTRITDNASFQSMSTAQNTFSIITAPSAGTPGVYELDGKPATFVSNADCSTELTLADVSQTELQVLVGEMLPEGTYDFTAAQTTNRRVRWTAPSADGYFSVSLLNAR